MCAREERERECVCVWVSVHVCPLTRRLRAMCVVLGEKRTKAGLRMAKIKWPGKGRRMNVFVGRWIRGCRANGERRQADGGEDQGCLEGFQDADTILEWLGRP